MAESTVFNPFYKANLGSFVRQNGSWGAVIIEGNISKMDTQSEEVQTFMTGESSCVYSDQMNQASMGISGSYGVTGVSKYSASISAYGGSASANLGKETSIICNIRILSGIERIDFNSLSIIDFMNSLNPKPRAAAAAVLDSYIALCNTFKEGEEYNTLLTSFQEGERKKLVSDWLSDLSDFIKEFGDGIVVGVVWGGVGYCSLKIIENATEKNLKYGGKANFTYAGTGASLAIGLAYDGSKSDKKSDVTTQCSSESSGRIATKPVNDWRVLLENVAFDKLRNVAPLSSAPKLDSDIKAPVAPEFEIPKDKDKDKPDKDKVANKIGAITNMDGLKALAMASAYDKTGGKIDDREVSLKEFIELSQTPNDTTHIPQANNNVSVLDNAQTAAQGSNRDENNFSLAQSVEEDTSSELARAGTADYAVLGVSIANWSDIFPWMSTGYLNQVGNSDTIKVILNKQIMVQDLLTLSKLYSLFDASGIKLEDTDINFQSIADSFKSRLAYLKENLKADTAIDDTFKGLSSDAKAIYKQWDKIQFLRDAELGLGIIANDKNSFIDDVMKVDAMPSSPIVWYKSAKSQFNAGNNNCDAFNKSLKVLPLMTPNGDIYAFGPSNMLLKSVMDANWAIVALSSIDAFVGFSKRGKSADFAKFSYDTTTKTLVHQSFNLKLYPIPFDAARGIEWKGQNFSTNITSNGTLKSKLDKLTKDLSNLNVCSFSSDTWKGWKPAYPYIKGAIKTQYIGIIDFNKDKTNDNS